MKFGILVFPGSNCDADCYHVINHVLKCPAQFVWHKETNISGFDVIVLPGGFSYGDYLRCGAIARFSPVMKAVCEFAGRGGKVLGICNGFQILLEAALLPGALIRNTNLKFICDQVTLKLQRADLAFSRKGDLHKIHSMPIAHMEGNYFVDEDGLKRLQDRDQVVLRYVDASSAATAASNPNGSVWNIAAVCNERGNVLGMMPHPERVSETILGGTDGRFIFESLLEK